MGIGLGIVLLVLGLILVADVIQADVPNIAEDTLGWILLVAGVVALVLSLVLTHMHRRHHDVVEEHHYGPPRR